MRWLDGDQRGLDIARGLVVVVGWERDRWRGWMGHELVGSELGRIGHDVMKSSRVGKQAVDCAGNPPAGKPIKKGE